MKSAIAIFLVCHGLAACSDAAALQGANKSTAEAVGKVDPSENTDTPNQQADTETPQADEKPADEAPVVEAPKAIEGAYLICAADYAALPAAATEAAYGCRLEFEGKRIKVPATATATFQFLAGANVVAATSSTALATSQWHWMVRTAAKGPFMANLVLANVNVTTSPLAVTEGTGKYSFAAAPVEGSALEWVPNAGIITLTQGATVRLNSPLNFPTVFPKFISVNGPALTRGAPAGSPAFPVVLGFVIGADRLTCRYFSVADLPTFYQIDLKTCRKGPTDFSRIDVTPVRNDLNNPAINWTLDMLVTGATAWYTDVVVFTDDLDPRSFAPRPVVREFKP